MIILYFVVEINSVENHLTLSSKFYYLTSGQNLR